MGVGDVISRCPASQALSKKAPYLWQFHQVRGGGHNDMEENFTTQYLTTVTSFLHYLRDDSGRRNIRKELSRQRATGPGKSLPLPPAGSSAGLPSSSASDVDPPQDVADADVTGIDDEPDSPITPTPADKAAVAGLLDSAGGLAEQPPTAVVEPLPPTAVVA